MRRTSLSGLIALVLPPALASLAVLAVPAAAYAAHRPAPRPARTAPAVKAGAPHRKLCPGSCRSKKPFVPVKTHFHGHRLAHPAALATGSWGFDMNGHGCNGTSFVSGGSPAGVTNAANLGFDAIQLNGWGWEDMYGDDPCFEAQLQWYQQNDAGNPIQFIMFPVPYDTNYCNSYSTGTSDGYDAGVGQAQQIYQKAVAAGLPTQGGTWWLDVEQDPIDCSGWNNDNVAANRSVIQGAVDYLHNQGLTVGIYTDLGDWDYITGSNTTEFASIPAWNAYPYSGSTFLTVYNNSGQSPYNNSTLLSWAQAGCNRTGYTGGTLTAVQFLWGKTSNAYYDTEASPAILGRDLDYQCRGTTTSGPPTATTVAGSGAMAATMTIAGSNFGAAQGSSYVHLWFTPDNVRSCTPDATTVNWGAPGNWAAFSVTGWSNTAISFQVPTPSGPDRQIGSTLGDDLWLIPAGDLGCLSVTTSGGTSGTLSFTAANPATQSYSASGWATGMNGPGVYGLLGGNTALNGTAALVCSDPVGQAILDQQGVMYSVWDLVDASGSYHWVWDGMMNTPGGGLTTHCSVTPAANPVPASLNVIIGLSEFRMGQRMNVFGAGFGASMGSGYVHLWTNNTAGTSSANCGNGSTTSTNFGEFGNSAAFTLSSWADTRVVFQNPTPSGPGQSGSQYQVTPGNWGCVTIFNSSGNSTWDGQYQIFVAQSPVTASYTTSGAANLRSGPSTADSVTSTASSGQSLTLICDDPNGQVVSGYGTWDQLSNGQWVWDGLMNTPAGGPAGLPQCSDYPPEL